MTLDSAQDGALHNKSNIFCRSLHYHFLKVDFPCVSRTRAKAQVYFAVLACTRQPAVRANSWLIDGEGELYAQATRTKVSPGDGTGGPDVESNLCPVRFGLLQLENIPSPGKKKGAMH